MKYQRRKQIIILAGIFTIAGLVMIVSAFQTGIPGGRPFPPPATREPAPSPAAATSTSPPAAPTASPVSQQEPAEPAAPLPGFYAAPYGTPDGNGSEERPWDLATALAQPAAVQPGATIWLRGGTYTGSFRSLLEGTEANPITVRQYPGERATIDASSNDVAAILIVEGAWTIFQDFEVTNSYPERRSREAGSHPNDLRRGSAISVIGNDMKFINLVIHDAGAGFSFFTSSGPSEIYGTIIYNNGWQGPDRDHGHGIYAQNEIGTKRIVDNIIFNQFGYGLHVYGSDQASLKGFHIEGNIAFNNGTLAPTGPNPNLLIGGGAPAERVSLLHNYTYHSEALAWNIQLGRGETRNRDIVCVDNYFAGGSWVLNVYNWEDLTITRNTIVGSNRLASFPDSLSMDTSGHQWDNNQFYYTGDGDPPPFAFQAGSASFEKWQRESGFDRNSQYRERQPNETVVFVRPNQYEAGRAHIVVYNWENLETVSVDVSQVLTVGTPYEVHNVQDYFGAPVVSGVYDGAALQLPMEGIPPPQLVGEWVAKPPVTGPAFQAFVLSTPNR